MVTMPAHLSEGEIMIRLVFATLFRVLIYLFGEVMLLKLITFIFMINDWYEISEQSLQDRSGKSH